MPAPTDLLDLIERFTANRDDYHKGRFNETQVRIDYLNPLFELLGWDMTNRAGRAEKDRDVIHEDAIKVGGVTKAPDYCFRIGAERKFFVEAKKPSVNIKESVDPAFQLRRYGWSAKLPVSILTDFEEFAVYDCRFKPDRFDRPTVARVMYFTFEELAGKWDEFAGVFSREAVLHGSFDRYAETSKAKRGTTEVDDAFLGEIEEWRAWLAQDIAKRNRSLTVEELNDAVQRTIDRIIFLRICEDRGIEDYGRLHALRNGANVYPRLMQVFHQADARYNSGLFHFTKEKGQAEQPDDLTPDLEMDDKTLKEIFRRLYYPDSPYEFSVLASGILGKVYEQFLGRVITLDKRHRATIEEKPEVRKAGGVYYTPEYIARYIVEQTIGRLLEGKAPRDVSTMRFLDMACGSGSFVLVAYSYLLDWHLDWYSKNEPEKLAKKKEAPIYQAPAMDASTAGATWRLTTGEKKRILLNNIFGVDIDRQAVEVTKLSLLLKMLEGESEQTLGRQLKLLHERVLPDLGNNITCGNSLIGSDFYDDPANASLDMETQKRINAFDWIDEFPEIMKAGGFDAVIGNPPYGAELVNIKPQYLKRTFETYVGRGESYLLFVERAIKLLRVNGRFSFIIPDTYLNLGFTQNLRQFLLENTKLEEVVVLPSNVFEGATVDTSLLFAIKQTRHQPYHESGVVVKCFNKRSPIRVVEKPDQQFVANIASWYAQNAFNVLSDPASTALVDRMDQAHDSLYNFSDMYSGIKGYEVGKGSPPQTAEIRDTKPFTSDSKKNKHWAPLYDGKHIGRYELLWRENNWILYGAWLAAPRDPQNFIGEKLLIRKIIGETLIATYVSETSYCNTLLFVLKLRPQAPFSYRYLLGLLNSRFIGWYFRKKFQVSADDTFPQIMIRDILQFAVPIPTKSNHDRMNALVDQMLSLHKQLAATKSSHDRAFLERQIEQTDLKIDRLVYELYGLSEEEIAIVEGS